MENMINNALGFSKHYANEPSWWHVFKDEDDDNDGNEVLNNEANEESGEFYELLHDVNQKLYKGCKKHSKLSFLVKLYHIKCLCRISNKGMSMILELLKEAFEHANIPSSFYKPKRSLTN